MNNKNMTPTPKAAPPMESSTPAKKKSLLDSIFPNNKNKKPKNPLAVPHSVQDSIPYVCCYPNGIIESEHGVFSKSYLLDDVNFKIASDEEQEIIFQKFEELLNMFGSEVKISVSVYNRNIDKEKFNKSVLLPLKGDALDTYRDEANAILRGHIGEGHNNLIKEKYITLSIEAENIDAAVTQFVRIDAAFSQMIKKINNCETAPCTIEQRLSLLYDIYNPDSLFPFYGKIKNATGNVSAFDLEAVAKMGLTTKDIIGPDSMTFTKDKFMFGDTYGRIMFLDTYASRLSTDFFAEINDIPCNMISTVHFNPLPQDKSVKLIRNQMVNINANVITAQKKASRSGYSAELISPDLIKTQDQAAMLLEDMTTKNQKLFMCTVVIALFADNEEDLETYTKTLQTVGHRFLCTIKKLSYQQEQGIASALPLGVNKVAIERLLTTETASLFIPFTAQELSQQNGMYYGLNAVSRNLIMYNRMNSNNASGVILGTPGSGKSFSAKREMINVLLSTNADVFVVDPEREYAPLAKMFGGEIIRVAAGSKTYINPLDMDIQYADEDDPISLKSDFISSLCETVIGGKIGLLPIQKSVIDRCVRIVFQPYMEYMKNAPAGVTCDREHMPTLIDFYELLLAQTEPEAQSIALALELYCRGSLDTFAHKTNVNTSSRFVIYDIKDIGVGMKEMGLQVCLNDIWNRIIRNKGLGKRTWFYLDEFYLLTQTESSALFLQKIYKRSRKWGGIPTGITQNVEDLLATPESRGIINNCGFIMMLNQSSLDRAELSAMLNISPEQMSYITNADYGQGLLYTGKAIVPFIDKYPRDTRTFQAMTTKVEDLEEYKRETESKSNDNPD